ncbi:MAG: glycosyltransferase family 4 protein [Alphaproteobacteria bacterium]|nr:glycosyltransferase family 4 protein [Alphaproteobacteria bacterium]
MPEKKLLYVINHIDWFWSHRLALAEGAQQEGWVVGVAVTGAGKDERLGEKGFGAFELPPADKGFAPFTILKIVYAVYNLLQKEKPDVVHAITLKYAFIAGLAARFDKNVRVVHTLAGLGYLFSGEGFKPKMLRTLVGPFLKLALKHPRAQIIFQNPDDQDLMIHRGFVHREQCHLIRGSGVDLDIFSVMDAQKEDPPIVLMPTRLVHDKGIAVFIQAACLLQARGVEARFQLAGGLTRNNPLAISKEQMEKMLENTPVEWLGRVEDMPGLLARASIICYPSYYGEGIPKVLLEAAASGLAIVTTDHPGCREAVKDGENGLLVPPRDARATADALETLLADKGLRAQMGQAGRKRAETHFDVRLIVKDTLRVYNVTPASYGEDHFSGG